MIDLWSFSQGHSYWVANTLFRRRGGGGGGIVVEF